MCHDYPILLDVSTRRCVIVGGGEVAARKAAGLIDSGATDVVVVSPELKGRFPANVQHLAERYRPEHLTGAGLAFAATDSELVNDAVVREANARGILVSRADAEDDLPGDFVVPAKMRRGPVTVTVSAGSAALAVLIRDQLSSKWDARWSHLAEAMQTLRPELLEHQLDPIVRRDTFRRLASEGAMDVLERGGLDALRVWMNQ